MHMGGSSKDVADHTHSTIDHYFISMAHGFYHINSNANGACPDVGVHHAPREVPYHRY